MEDILLDNLNDVDIPIIITDVEGNLLSANNIASEIFGLSLETLKKSLQHNIVFYNDYQEKVQYQDLPFIKSAQQKKTIPDVKLQFVNNEGKKLWYKANSIYLKADAEKEEKVITTFWDITDTKKLEIGLQKQLKILVRFFIQQMPAEQSTILFPMRLIEFLVIAAKMFNQAELN